MRNQIIPRVLVLCGLLLSTTSLFANIPGGGTNGPNVTLTDNGTTVTIANGIMSIVCTKSSAQIGTINYTFNNNGSTQTLNLVSGNANGGKLYWENSSSEGLGFTYSLVTDPASNGGNYAEISLITTSVANDTLEVHYSMLRGSTGFYVTAIYGHRSIDAAFGMGECRDNIYAGSIFNWMSVDAQRHRVMEVSGGTAIGVQGAPVEVSLWTTGLYAGQYEDKYKYSADLGLNHVWGWSSVGSGGKNVGLWNITASSEYYNGGPYKRELMEHIGTTVLNMLNGGHYGMGSDGNFTSGEVWSKVCGPYFIYCNNVSNNITAASTAAEALYTNALAQGEAEADAWPYYWFTNAGYAPASNRGTVTGTMAISDTGNPNASAANLWVGVVQQPTTSSGTYDFQEWMKPYQFWTRTDANGNFTISNAIAGANYTLYAFGGSPDLFMSQSQSGGNPPVLTDVPASPFSVTVTGGVTNNLGTVTWTPQRVGPTVFEIGYPDRTSSKFRHGDDWWVGEIGPSSTAPSPIWSRWLEFPFDFPNSCNYVVGQNHWNTDWNFVQPVTVGSNGSYNNSSSTITFNLATNPVPGATASLYLGLASDYSAAIIVTVNGNNLGSVGGVTGSPNNSIPSTGYYAGYMGSDTTIREGNQAAASDERINFPASLLHSNANSINIGIRQTGGSYFADHAMYDYIRLELTGYVPPPPASVSAFPGNNANLVTWPVTPGATSYNLLRSTSPNSGFASITNGIVGAVCGSGSNNAVYVDGTAVNGTTYYYEVCSVNPTRSSTNSPASGAASPSASLATTPPAAPTGLNITGLGHMTATVNWTAPTGANLYSVWRSTLANSGGGSSNTLSTILLNNAVTGTSYTDPTPNDGSIYSYFVTATSAGGVSGNSSAVTAVPLPGAPATPPPSVLANFSYGTTTNVVLTWTAVPGAVGYVISRSTSLNGTYTYLQTVTETTYTDSNLNPGTVYYYHVSAMNLAAATVNVADSVNSQQAYPPSLTAVATNAQVKLTWTAPASATSYTIKRGTTVGGESTTVVTGYTGGTTYTNTGLVNGTTYYYVVTATGGSGTSGNSPEASATPYANGSGLWISTANGIWSATTNWSSGSVATGPGSSANFSTLSLPTNLTVTLDTARTIGSLTFGDITATYNWIITGTNALTFAGTPGVTVLNDSATLSAPVAGTVGLPKIGPGKLILGGATNTFTGGVNVSLGTLTADYSTVNSPLTNIIPAANALTLAGGAVQITGSTSSGNIQTFASTTVSAGASLISAAPVSGANLPTVNLSGISANAGGVVEFVGPATIGSGGGNVAATASFTTSTAGDNSAFIGGNGTPFFDALFATVGLYDFAAATGGAAPYPVVGGSQVSGFYTPTSGTAGTSGNLDVTGNITGWSAQPYLTSFRFNTSIGANISVAAYSTLTIDDILVTPNVGAYNVSINNNGLRPGGGSSSYAGPFVMWQNNTAGELILNSFLGNSKAGSATYVQAGPGTVFINNTTSGYTGQSYLNGGVTLITANGSLGIGSSGSALNLNGGTLCASGTFTLARAVTLLANGGGLAATAGNTLTVDGLVGSASGAGALTIGVPASAANNNTPGLLPGTGTGTANTTPVNATGTVALTNANFYTGGTLVQNATLNINGINALGGANYGGLTLNSGTLQYATGLTGNNGSADLTSIGSAGLTLAAGGSTVDLNGNAVAYAGSIGNHGLGALVVKSSLPGSSLALNGANTYSGNTTVSNAILSVNNPSGSGTGAGDLTLLNAAQLNGDGSVAGSVNVSSGATLSPGGFSIGNNLTLASGSTTFMQVSHSPFTNTTINISGTLNAGGTLIVTNLGGALTNGDTFQLFSAAAISGNFSSLVLPPLTGDLIWNTNAFATTGALSVVAPAAPTFAGVQFSGADLTLSGSGGTANWPYVILECTDLGSGNWTPVLTNQLDASGNFSATLTNAAGAGQPQVFYRIRLQ